MKNLPYFLFAICLSSCISVKPLEVKNIKNFAVKEIKSDYADVEAVITIKNPNGYKIKVKNAKFDAYLNNKELGKVNLNDKIIISKNSSNDYTLNMKVDYAKILAVMPSMLFSNSATINLIGNIKVKVFLFSKKFHLDIKEKVAKEDIQI